MTERGDGLAGLDLAVTLGSLLPGIGPAIEALGGPSPQVQRQRAATVLTRTLELAEQQPGWVEQQARAHAGGAKILAETIRAVVADEDLDEKREAYARLLVAGLGSEDQVDGARMAVEVIAQLRRPSIGLLARASRTGKLPSRPNQPLTVDGLSERLLTAAQRQLQALGLIELRVETMGRDPGARHHVIEMTSWGRVIHEALRPA